MLVAILSDNTIPITISNTSNGVISTEANWGGNVPDLEEIYSPCNTPYKPPYIHPPKKQLSYHVILNHINPLPYKQTPFPPYQYRRRQLPCNRYD